MKEGVGHSPRRTKAADPDAGHCGRIRRQAAAKRPIGPQLACETWGCPKPPLGQHAAEPGSCDDRPAHDGPPAEGRRAAHAPGDAACSIGMVWLGKWIVADRRIVGLKKEYILRIY